MSEEQKLTKKQLKAQQFKKSKDERETDKEDKKRKREEEEKQKLEQEQTPKKKRKTRRGKGGKGTKKGNRFIVFVGNIGRETTASQLQAHFKASSPDHIRMRQDKGIAFLEFDGDKDHENIQRRMDVALLQHKTMLGDRKINVELTVGGGGNSATRLEKLRTKNDKLDIERNQRMAKLINDSRGNKKTDQDSESNGAEKSEPKKPSSVPAGIHPDRARFIK
ncbi:Nop6 [Kluyveromyces lactis]|nr:Nop6 [Kluyveromyces lactis]